MDLGRSVPIGARPLQEVTIPDTDAPTVIAPPPVVDAIPAVAVVDRQVENLVSLGYPSLAGLSEAQFVDRLAPLREAAAALPDVVQGARAGHAPVVLVVTGELVDPERTVPMLRLAPRGTRAGILDRNHGEAGLAPYRPIDEVRVPDPTAYLLLDVDRGEEFLGVRPEEALPVILARGRTPLTIEEGIAVVTHAPEVLERNRCFMLSGSRRGDRRVPAMWISAGAPKLGWCWDGNPHDWLGVASTGGRITAPAR